MDMKNNKIVIKANFSGRLKSIGGATSILSNIAKVYQDLGACHAKVTGVRSMEELCGSGNVWILPPTDKVMPLQISARIKALGGNFM